MVALWETLGYDEVASDLVRNLSDPTKVTLLEGPPGVGKSWLAREVGALWETHGGRAVVVEGDGAWSSLPLYPFGYAMIGLPGSWRSVASSAVGVSKAAESFLGTGGLITTAAQGMVSFRRNRKRRKVFLGDREHEILRDLQRLGKRRPILLIADNLHWWDSESLRLLHSLRQTNLRQAFPFLEGLRLLAVETPEPYQTVASPDAHRTLLEGSAVHHVRLGRIQRRGFDLVLAALGAPDLAPNIVDTIYSLSGGHLSLASRTARLLQTGDATAIVQSVDSTEFLRGLVTDRVLQLGDLGSKAHLLLQVAALIGLAFRREELACALGLDEHELSRLLRSCRDEQVIELRDGTGRFSHDIIRQVFLDMGDSERVDIHQTLAECLRRVRPGDYEVRGLNELRGEQPIRAGMLAVLASIQRERTGRSLSSLAPELHDAVLSSGLDEVLRVYIDAIRLVRQYKHKDCLALIDQLPLDLPKPLMAEADYIRALCLMATRSETDREQARLLLEAWNDFESEEPEIGVRLSRLLLYGLTHLVEKAAARTLEGKIQRGLIDRVEFDQTAKDELYTLYRCAGSLYPPDIAVVRCREAAEHFSPGSDSEVVRRPSEYYRCLVNLGANQISNVQYQDAVATFERLDGLVNQYPASIFPRRDYPLMNRILAQYRCGELSAKEAAARQSAVVRFDDVRRDPFYAYNALAAYSALAGDASAATGIYRFLDIELSKRSEPEPSMIYLIGTNHCAARFLEGEDFDSIGLWKSFVDVLQAIPYTTRPFLLRRHQLLGTLFESGRTLDAIAFDEYLPRTFPNEIGPQWDNYGRGFRLPEVEFWRDY
jgi:tetratricopeptide (TPR) repeat protein